MTSGTTSRFRGALETPTGVAVAELLAALSPASFTAYTCTVCSAPLTMSNVGVVISRAVALRPAPALKTMEPPRDTSTT